MPQASSFDRSTNFFQNLHGSYSDSEVFCKKELAGRTMEFSFDVSQTPLIGRRLLLKPDLETNVSTQARISQPLNANFTGTPNSPRRSTSLSPADTAPLSGWKRPWMSQSRVRECLVNLLTTCGQRVGLPKSPSVSNSISANSSQLIQFCFGSTACCAAGRSLVVFSFTFRLINSINLFPLRMQNAFNVFLFDGNQDEILSSLCSKVNEAKFRLKVSTGCSGFVNGF